MTPLYHIRVEPEVLRRSETIFPHCHPIFHGHKWNGWISITTVIFGWHYQLYELADLVFISRHGYHNIYSKLRNLVTHSCPEFNGNTVYPKKYAHGFCFAVLFCGYTLTDFPISIRLTSLALWQSNDCPSASKATLMNMDKYFMWIHYERLHNHNKAKHNKTVCIFLGIYCKTKLSLKLAYKFEMYSISKEICTRFCNISTI